MLAAFTTEPAPVTSTSSVWRLPRYVSGRHWKSPAELERLLRSGRRVAVGPSPSIRAATTGFEATLRTYEINDAAKVAGELFKRCFGHPIPDYPRHFVMVYSPAPGDQAAEPRVVAYIHHLNHDGCYLAGGLCVDERVYRRLPEALFRSVKGLGGLATMILRDSLGFLAEAPAAFAHVGEPRARQALLRAGFLDTGRPHIMAAWLTDLPPARKSSILDSVQSFGPF